LQRRRRKRTDFETFTSLFEEVPHA
jgi:hypothetical protein